MSTAFHVSGLCKRYPEFALQNIELTLEHGQIMGLVGVNGAGKTTLLRLLTGLTAPDAGQIEVLGQRMPEHQVAAKRDMGFASEDMRLYKTRTLRWHMDLIRAIYPAWDESYASELLRRFDLRPEQILKGYSHGQRVKALLLLCLARRPRLLLLDEPTTGLDPVARVEVLEALADVLRDEARSVLFSSHNTHDVEQLADSIAFLHQGRLLECRDREAFVDNWRRIVCRGTWRGREAGIPEVISARQTGSLLELKLRDYRDELLPALKQQGLEIHSVDMMALEDIFITTVRPGVTHEAA